MSQMTKDQAIEFFSELYGGVHHIPYGMREFGDGWAVCHHGDLSTYDFNTLTRLVFLAHDRCVRVELMQGGPRSVKIAIFQRDTREGDMFEKHPTIEQALASWRQKHPIEEVR